MSVSSHAHYQFEYFLTLEYIVSPFQHTSIVMNLVTEISHTAPESPLKLNTQTYYQQFRLFQLFVFDYENGRLSDNHCPHRSNQTKTNHITVSYWHGSFLLSMRVIDRLINQISAFYKENPLLASIFQNKYGKKNLWRMMLIPPRPKSWLPPTGRRPKGDFPVANFPYDQLDVSCELREEANCRTSCQTLGRYFTTENWLSWGETSVDTETKDKNKDEQQQTKHHTTSEVLRAGWCFY